MMFPARELTMLDSQTYLGAVMSREHLYDVLEADYYGD